VYGHQWRFFGAPYKDCHASYAGLGVDQLAQVIHAIKTNPNDRRIIMSAWNPTDLGKMALPPCHVMCQFYVDTEKKVGQPRWACASKHAARAKHGLRARVEASLADPASFRCLLLAVSSLPRVQELSCQMYQRSCDLGLGVPFNIASYSLLTVMIAHICDLQPGDFVHVLADAHVYMNHVEPLQQQLARTPREFPTLGIKRRVSSIEEFTFEDFDLQGYKPLEAIKMQMAV
jgi:thymidylate synthase